MEEDLLMPALPVFYYEPKDTSRMNSEELRRERILRRHLKSKFFPTPPPHMLEKLLEKQQRRQQQHEPPELQQLLQQQQSGGKGTKSARSFMRQRERPWATGSSASFEESVEAQKIRNVFLEDSKKCAFHKSPYLQPQARFHTRDPGNRPGVTEGTWLLARPQPNGLVAMETKHVGQPAPEGTVTYRFSKELLKAREGISKGPWSGPTVEELRPPPLALDLRPFEDFPKSKLNFAHLPEVRQRADIVRARYVNKVRSKRAAVSSDFRVKFYDQMRHDVTPLKTQQRLTEMLDRYVPRGPQLSPRRPPLLGRPLSPLPVSARATRRKADQLKSLRS